jgi:hypothetical protein
MTLLSGDNPPTSPRRWRWITVAPIFFAAILIAIPGSAHAQNCGAAGKEIRALQSDAFDDFPALNDVKQGILLMLYGRGSADCPEELYAFAMAGKDFLITFDEAYSLGQSNMTENRSASLDKAKVLRDIVVEMEKQDLGASAIDVATSADAALINFLLAQGSLNEREGGLAIRTRDKIAHYRLATLAYEAADENILAANTRLKWKSLEAEYNADMERADRLFDEAERLMESAHQLSGSIPTKIDAYVDAMEALELYSAALGYYKIHNEEEKIQVAEERIAAAERTLAALRGVLILYFTVLTVLLIGVSMYLLNRLLAWREDTYEYYLGNELIKVKGVE